MRLLNKNRQPMWYALQGKDTVPVYEYYTGEDGVKYPVETGEYRTPYLTPVPFEGNIATSGGNSENAPYGLDLSDYEAILVLGKDSLPITETSLIWQNTEPQYNEDGTVDEHSADYKVVKKSPSLNVWAFALKQVVK